ncbi:MAG: cyclic-di-AMP receptor [Anaerolineales bacterium]|nr:cyclic-di-AMP receptor [Anaerolineales bacterium]
MTKKMILAILEDTESNSVMRALHDAGYPLTLIDSTGGLLRRGNSTVIAGVDESDVDDVIKLINLECSPSVNPFKKRATIMVFAVDHFEQIS